MITLPLWVVQLGCLAIIALALAYFWALTRLVSCKHALLDRLNGGDFEHRVRAGIVRRTPGGKP
jgi:hypothetical protein